MKRPTAGKFSSMKRTVFFIYLLLVPPCVYDAEDVWGDLRGKFTFQGTIPPPRTLPTTKAGPGIPSLVKDETLLVDTETRGIENIVVWLERDSPEMPLRPGYERELPPVTWSMRAGAFSPHVIVMSTHQKLYISQEHGAYNPQLLVVESANRRKVIARDSVPYLLPQPERNPVEARCDLRTWMRGYLILKDHPYVDITTFCGEFQLIQLPVGRRQFRIWHERANFIVPATAKTPTTVNKSLRTGVVEIDIKSGLNDLGTIVLSGDLFME